MSCLNFLFRAKFSSTLFSIIYLFISTSAYAFRQIDDEIRWACGCSANFLLASPEQFKDVVLTVDNKKSLKDYSIVLKVNLMQPIGDIYYLKNKKSEDVREVTQSEFLTAHHDTNIIPMQFLRYYAHVTEVIKDENGETKNVKADSRLIYRSIILEIPFFPFKSACHNLMLLKNGDTGYVVGDILDNNMPSNHLYSKIHILRIIGACKFSSDFLKL